MEPAGHMGTHEGAHPPAAQPSAVQVVPTRQSVAAHRAPASQVAGGLPLGHSLGRVGEGEWPAVQGRGSKGGPG